MSLPISEFWKNAARRGGYQSDCKTCSRKRNQAYLQTEQGREAMRRAAVKKYHGLDLEDYDAYMALPCQICKAPSEHLDHDHETGRIRGPLCQPCNLGLGHFRDSPDNLRRAVQYLS